MEKEVPRIKAITVEVPTSLLIRWEGKSKVDEVNLVGWIATGGDTLSPLKDAATFRQAHVSAYGRAVSWDEDGDLAIDAFHLKMLADEQRPFSNNDVRVWQVLVNISNNEAADFVGVSLSTWNSYKLDAKIPQSVAITLRCALRDPLLMQAHLRPRIAGRPPKSRS
jgi:hypothetical protein